MSCRAACACVLAAAVLAVGGAAPEPQASVLHEDSVSLLQMGIVLQRGPVNKEVKAAPKACYGDEVFDEEDFGLGEAALAGVSLMQSEVAVKKGPVSQAAADDPFGDFEDEDELMGLMDAVNDFARGM